MPELIAGPAKRAPKAPRSIAGAINPNMFAGEHEAMYGLGATLSRMGGQFAIAARRMDEAQRIREKASAETTYEYFWDRFQSELLRDTDYIDHRTKFNVWHDSEKGRILEGLKSKRAKPDVLNFLEKQRAIRGNEVETKAWINYTAATEREIPAFINSHARRALELSEEGQKDEFQKIDDYLQDLQKNGFLGPGRLEVWKGYRAQIIVQAAIENNPEAASAMLEDGNLNLLLSEEDIDRLGPEPLRQLKRAALTESGRRLGTRRAEIEAMQEQTRNKFLVALRNKDLKFEKIMDSGLPTEGPLGKNGFIKMIDAQAKEALRGTDIVNNPQVEADLEKMAYQITTGAVTRQEFDIELNNARYRDKPQIDDQAYDELASLASRKFESFQSEAMADAISHSQGQLVTVRESMLEVLIGAIQQEPKVDKKQGLQDHLKEAKEKRKLELDNLDRYRKVLRDWLKKNPDANADEIYIESRKLLAQFRRFTLSEINSRREQREREMLLQSKYAGLDIKKLEKLDKELTEGMQKTTKKPTQEEFVNRVGLLKSRGKNEEAKKYYDKWVGEISW